MCIVERKTHVHPDDHSEVIETVHYCRRAPAGRTCARTEFRDTGKTRIVEVKPPKEPSKEASSPGPSKESLLVTEGRGGSKHVYRPVLRDSGKGKSAIRRSKESSRTSPLPSPDLTSPSNLRASNPRAPTPPPAISTDRLSYPPTLPEEGARKVRIDGTAVYDRPPSLEMPRAVNNEASERPRPTVHQRRPTISGGNVNVEASRRSSFRSRRPSDIFVDTSVRNSTATTTSTLSSPGLSSLPRVSSLRDSRYDSAMNFPPSDKAIDTGYRNTRSTREEVRRSQAELEHRRRRKEEEEEEEERVQAAKDQERVRSREMARQRGRSDAAASTSAAERLARDVSRTRRDRHRRAAEAALEGEREAKQRLDFEAEERQRLREFEASETRRRFREEEDAVYRYTEAQLRRDYEAQAAMRSRYPYQSIGTVVSPSRSRPGTADSYHTPAPLSARVVTTTTTTTTRPQIHQLPSARRGSTLRERGQEVLAREQARSDMRDVTQSMDTLAVADDEDEEVDYIVDYYTSSSAGGALGRRQSKHDRRERERHERRSGFWQ